MYRDQLGEKGVGRPRPGESQRCVAGLRRGLKRGRAWTSSPSRSSPPAFTRALAMASRQGLRLNVHTLFNTFVLTPKSLKCSPVLTPHSGQVFAQSVLTS
eukprot:7383984-Prymnesium_polylepis.1